MSKWIVVLGVVLTCGMVFADTFGTGDNQFTIDFVDISGDTNPTVQQANEGDLDGYGIVNNDYRMGKFEITNDQWSKFQSSYGVVMGSELNTQSGGTAYDESTFFTGTNIPTNEISWYEAAQFVNYLNISTGRQAAYKFTGTQGTPDYTYALWESGDAGYNASNPFRNSNAHYFLPTDDEWFKAAYWNGTSIQNYATIDDSTPTAGVDANYDNTIDEPWDVGSGPEELNGTFDMMGNIVEWLESPRYWVLPGSTRGVRGGSYGSRGDLLLLSSNPNYYDPYVESANCGFRVASVPEPMTISLLALGGLVLRRKR